MTHELRSYDAWRESVRNFDWLMQAVSGATDVDCLIERKGRFLVVEGKPWTKGVRLPYGQHRALYALSKQPNTRVYLVGEDGDTLHVLHYNSSPAPVYLRRERTSFFPPEFFTPTTRPLFVELVQSWWADASEAA